MTGRQSAKEAILDAFIVAYRDNAASLGRYCRDHPDLRDEFLALVHEMELQQALAHDGDIDAAFEEWIAAAVLSDSRSVRDPFARLNPRSFAALRQTLGVPTIVINAFRDRLVVPRSVPFGFLERLADALSAELEPLAAYLNGPPRLATNAHFKADRNPSAPQEKMSFTALLDEAGVDTKRQAEILGEDD